MGSHKLSKPLIRPSYASRWLMRLRRTAPAAWWSAAWWLLAGCEVGFPIDSNEDLSGPPLPSAVIVYKIEVTDPITGVLYGEACAAADGLDSPNPMVGVPLGRAYQVDLARYRQDGTLTADHDQSYYCASNSLTQSGTENPDPSCSASRDPEIHELISAEVLDVDGVPLSRFANGVQRFKQDGDFERYVFVSHGYGEIFVQHDINNCLAGVPDDLPAERLFTIVSF